MSRALLVTILLGILPGSATVASAEPVKSNLGHVQRGARYSKATSIAKTNRIIGFSPKTYFAKADIVAGGEPKTVTIGATTISNAVNDQTKPGTFSITRSRVFTRKIPGAKKASSEHHFQETVTTERFFNMRDTEVVREKSVVTNLSTGSTKTEIHRREGLSLPRHEVKQQRKLRSGTSVTFTNLDGDQEIQLQAAENGPTITFELSGSSKAPQWKTSGGTAAWADPDVKLLAQSLSNQTGKMLPEHRLFVAQYESAVAKSAPTAK